MNNEKYFVIDTETIPQQNQPEWMKEYVLKKTENKRGENKGNIDKYSSLNPEFGEVCCICLYNSLDDTSHVFFEETEKETLQGFWDYLKDNIDNHRFVGFNSKSFDVPYLKKRSSIKKVNTFSIDISTRKYYIDKHYDILEVLSNFGAFDFHSLDVYCHIYNTDSTDSIDGSNIYELYKKGDFDAICNHCLDDVTKTKELYLKVKDYL